MTEKQCSLIAKAVLEVTGIAVEVSSPPLKGGGLRRPLLAHFTGYTSQEGPRFALQAHGLRSQRMTAEMGNFAAPCIKQMQNAGADSLAFARSIIRQLDKEPGTKVTISPNQNLDDWVVTDTGFRIEVITASKENQYSDEMVSASAAKFMAPMLAALAELIGFDEPEDYELPENANIVFDTEGKLTTAIVRKRERSRKNRLLCLAIHGHRCCVCGMIPEEIYPGLSGIIEVHHIEPVSTLLAPKIYDPNTDLIPLCPTCHRAIHSKFPAMMPDELRAIMKISA
jgi:5-methylcytosine-specific restriction protein A